MHRAKQLKYCLSIILPLVVVLTFNIAEAETANWTHWDKAMESIKQKDYNNAFTELNYYFLHPDMHRDFWGVAYFGRALVFEAQERYKEALEEYKKSIENDYFSVSITEKALLNMASLYFKMKNYDDAVNAYKKLIDVNTKSGLGYYYLGMSYYEKKEYDLAWKNARIAQQLGIPFTALIDKLKKVTKEPPEAVRDQGGS